MLSRNKVLHATVRDSVRNSMRYVQYYVGYFVSPFVPSQTFFHTILYCVGWRAMFEIVCIEIVCSQKISIQNSCIIYLLIRMCYLLLAQLVNVCVFSVFDLQIKCAWFDALLLPFCLIDRFATRDRNALLLYNGRFNEKHDFVALEIIDEQVQLTFSAGENTLHSINDGFCSLCRLV